MPRKVRVLTTSYFGVGKATVAENRATACDFVRAAGAERADLVCLPEDFLQLSMPRPERTHAEPLDGPTFAALAVLARAHNVWVVGSYCVHDAAGQITNTAVVIDRQGRLAGYYAKAHPTIFECEGMQITPGDTDGVIDTDFGRIGLAICYDIGWPDHWRHLAERGAELVIWPSAYDGGFPLQSYAWTHQYYIASSVHGEHSKVIDRTGRILATTSRWHHLAATTIDLESEIFHIDDQAAKLLQIQEEMGARVTAQAYSEENLFILESNDDAWPLARIKAHYGLENFRDYHARAARVQARCRAGAAVAVPAGN